MLIQEWAVLKDWPNYEVSNYGEVKNLKMDRYMKGSVNRDGYLQVTLSQGKKMKTVAVHRLVAILFVPGYFEGAVVKHLDNNKRNDRADNLKWVTLDKIVRRGWISLEQHYKNLEARGLL